MKWCSNLHLGINIFSHETQEDETELPALEQTKWYLDLLLLEPQQNTFCTLLSSHSHDVKFCDYSLKFLL